MQKSKRIIHFISHALSLLLFAYPILLLSVRNGMSTCLVLLALISIAYFLQVDWSSTPPLRRADIFFCVSMASLIVATIFSELYHGDIELKTLDSASRFLLAAPIYLMLRTTRLTYPRALEFGFPLGALVGFLTSILLPPPPVQLIGTYFLDAPMFGGAMLTLGFLSLSTIRWTHRDNRPLLALKIFGFVLGLYCAIRSGERGIWIAIPVLAVIWMVYFVPPKKWRLFTAATAIALAIAAYWLIPNVQTRIAATQWEIGQIAKGNFNTSAGQRLQIWNAAIQIISRNPIAGIGPVESSGAIRKLGAEGWFTAGALKSALAQTHNEILAHAMKLGVFGLIAILSIYFVPIAIFARNLRAADRIKRRAGVMGMLFATAYFIFGLSVETFNLKMLASYYAVTISALLAITLHVDVTLCRNARPNSRQE